MRVVTALPNAHLTRGSVVAGSRRRFGYYDVLVCVVTIGIWLDWLPAYARGLEPGTLSLTRYLVAPLIAVDAVFHWRSYREKTVFRTAVLYLVCIGIGTGSGVLLGNVELERLIALLPTATILWFFATKAAGERRLLVLQVSLLCSAATLGLQVLAEAGYLPISAEVLYGDEYQRALAGPSWAELPFYGLVPAASLGGLLLLGPRRKAGAVRTSLAVMVLAIGVAGLLVTGQRTALIAFVGAAVFAAALSARAIFKRSAVGWAVCAILVVVALVRTGSGAAMGFKTDTIEYRLENDGIMPTVGGSDKRAEFWLVFTNDLVTSPSFFAPGMSSMISKAGGIPHSILAEAYYDGGIVLLLALVWLVGLSIVRPLEWLIRNWAVGDRFPAVVILTVALGAAVATTFHPGLRTRIEFMLLGLACGVPSREAKEDTTRCAG